MKQVVLESHKDGVVFHALFERMAQHYGFRAVPLAPGYKEGKGKVENPFKYVEGNFLAGRTFHDLDDLNQQAQRWLVEIARVRVHRTTREQPAARLTQEQPALIPLPRTRFEAGVVVPRLVGADFCVAWDTNRYSVPPRFASKSAMVRVLDGRIEILIDAAVVAAHVVRSTKYQRYVAPEHEAEFRATCTSRHVLKDQFQRLGADRRALRYGPHRAARRLGRLPHGPDPQARQQGWRRTRRRGPAPRRSLRRLRPQRGRAHRRRQAREGDRSARPRARPAQRRRLEQYLKGTGVHQRSPDGYKKLVGKRNPSPSKPTDDDEKKEEDDGDGK